MFTRLHRWLSSRNRPTATVRKQPARLRPLAEVLEDRLAPALLTVNTLHGGFDHGDGLLSLSEAVEAVNSGSTVVLAGNEVNQVKVTQAFGQNDRIEFDRSLFDPGFFEDGPQPRDFVLDSGLTLAKSVQIVGPTIVSGDTTFSKFVHISGNDSVRPITVTQSTVVSLQHLVIKDGRSTGVGVAADGGGILNNGTLTIDDCTIRDNVAQRTSAAGAPLTGSGGGGIKNLGALTITNSTISGNESTSGAGIRNEGTLTMTASTISSNTAIGAGGGGISNGFGTATITNSTISHNLATTNGHGGGISNVGVLTIVGSTISQNTAGSNGGGIDNAAESEDYPNMLNIIASTISQNNAANGAGVSNDGYVSSTVHAEGKVTVAGSTISGNTATYGAGGGFQNLSGSTLTITGSSISDNTALTGGGIYGQGGKVMVTNSTISENTATFGTGGIRSDDAILNVVNTTISGNKRNFGTDNTGTTGGIFFFGAGSASIINSTIANNHGAGINNSSTPVPVTLVNSIVTEAIVGSIAVAFNNLVRASGNGITHGVNGNIVAAYVGLTVLFDNGGPTKTHALFSDSPAINKGDTARAMDPGPDGVAGNGDDIPLTGDGRGVYQRIADGRVDIGAHESGARFAPVSSAGDGDDGDLGAGQFTLREAVRWANTLAGPDIITFAPGIDVVTLTNGELQLTDLATTTIDGGSGVSIQRVASKRFRLFSVFPGARAQLSNLTIAGGDSRGDGPGGAIANGGTLAIDDTTIAGNGAQSGGGIANYGVLTIRNSTIKNNSTLAIDIFDFNNFGGGILNQQHASLVIFSSTISGNYGGDGGGIYNQGDFSFFNSTLSENHATFSGGGIYNSNGGNDASSDTLAVVNSTIAFNRAGVGGGIYAGHFEELLNTIVARNVSIGTDPSDIEGGAINTAYNNLIGSSATDGGISNIVVGGNNLIGVDPMLGLLANNGGPTETHALLPYSPAINAGDFDWTNKLLGSAAANYDQRGDERKRLDKVDIGAVEFNGVIPENLVVSTEDDVLDSNLTAGNLSLREAIAIANLRPGADTITFAPAVGVITLILDQIQITDSLKIDGGQAGVSIVRDEYAPHFRILDIAAPATAKVELVGLTISGGLTTQNGGGINIQSGLVSITNSVISGNSGRRGGGIHNDGMLTITGSTIVGNRAEEAGGGIANSNFLDVGNSTISTNSAQYTGGGIVTNWIARIVNATVAFNSVYGAGPDVLGGGGIYASGTETVYNTIVVGNVRGTTANDISRTIETARHNLIGDDATDDGVTHGLNGNITGVPWGIILSTAFENHGGPTVMHALLPGSPAINAGDNALAVLPGPDLFFGTKDDFPLLTDQRGRNSTGFRFDRVGGGTVDIGAFESPGVTLLAPSLTKSAPTSVSVRVTGVPDFPNSYPVTFDVDFNNDGDFSDEYESGNSGGNLVHGVATFGIGEPSPGTYRLRANVGGILSQVVTMEVDSTVQSTEFAVTPHNIQDVIDNLVQTNDTLVVSPGVYGGVFINNKFVVIEPLDGNVVIQGASPALIVSNGEVVVRSGITFTNATDAPTILVQNGGKLILRGSTIEESTAYEQRAIVVEDGGVLDLGSDADPGGNTINVNGEGSFLDRAPNTTVAAAGNTWAEDNIALPGNVLLVTTAVDQLSFNPNVDLLSLRAAILEANRRAGPDVILFADGLSGQTLHMTLGQVDILDDVTIIGPGSRNMTITSDGITRILMVGDNNDVYRNVVISGLTFTGGNAPDAGGAIISYENLTLRDCVFLGNAAAHSGGAVAHLRGNLVISGSTFSGNTSGPFGGAVSATNAFGSGGVLVSNSTFSGNSAVRFGGALHLAAAGSVQIVHVTVTGNRVTLPLDENPSGGGISTYGGPGNITLVNSLVAGNTRGPNQTPDDLGSNVAAPNSSLNNLIGAAASAGGLVNNLRGNIVGLAGQGVRPLDTILNPVLADNGGLTPTHTLTPGSLARDGALDFANGMMVTPTAVTSLTAGTDPFPARQLIDNSGLADAVAVSNFTSVQHTSAANGTSAWVTADTLPDYYGGSRPDPVLTFSLGAVVSLTDLVVWGYDYFGPNNNEAKFFHLDFSTDGGVTFGATVDVVQQHRAGTSAARLSLGGTYQANVVRMTIFDNFFGAAGANGGDRVGLGEVKFIATGVIWTDQRGPNFPQLGAPDIGAFEDQTAATARSASRIQALPAGTQDSAQITLVWSGQPAHGNVAITGFDIYQAQDGGAFEKILSNTTAQTHTLAVDYGHTYRFFSVAHDSSGGIEAAPMAPDATVAVKPLPNPPVTVFDASQRIVYVYGGDASDTISLAVAKAKSGLVMQVTRTVNKKAVKDAPVAMADFDRVLILTGGGVDVITVVGLIGKTIQVEGGAGADTITITDPSATVQIVDGLGQDKVVVNGNTKADNAFILDTSLVRVNNVVVTFDQVASLTVGGQAKKDQFSFHGVPSVPTTLAGGAGTDTVVGSDTVNEWDIAEAGGGKLNGALAFTGIENLTGGAERDVFAMKTAMVGKKKTTGKLTGKIDGGGGVNVLDYSAWTTAATVDLSKAKTTATNTGGVANIGIILGGSGADKLTAGAAGHVLIGNGGKDTLKGSTAKGVAARDILIGGSGDDTLDGLSGEDILIGGLIPFVNEAAKTADINALFAIHTEWKRTDLSYDQRMTNLLEGGGANGATLLAAIDDNGVKDTLSGGPDLDWFFALAPDIVKDPDL